MLMVLNLPPGGLSRNGMVKSSGRPNMTITVDCVFYTLN